jgi:polar amino acid transport system substrate-binding protein
LKFLTCAVRISRYGCGALTLALFSHHAWAAKTYTIIAEDDWYPYSSQIKGISVGFAVDVVRAAYSAVGVDVRFKVASFKSCMAQVEAGTELGCFDINRDEDTRARFIFHSESLFADTGGIYAMEKPGMPARVAPQNLIGYRVGFTNGAVYGDFLDRSRGIQREYAMSDLSNLRKLVAGRQDFSLVSTVIADYIFKTHPDDFTVMPKLVGVVSNQKMFVGFSQKRAESKEAAALLDAGLIKIRANGTYRKIETQWLGNFQLPEKFIEPKSKK